MQDILERSLMITISAGVASLDKYKSKSALIEAADTALYDAKGGGRNQVRIAS